MKYKLNQTLKLNHKGHLVEGVIEAIEARSKIATPSSKAEGKHRDYDMFFYSLHMLGEKYPYNLTVDEENLDKMKEGLN